jgi:hypothetical protein
VVELEFGRVELDRRSAWLCGRVGEAGARTAQIRRLGQLIGSREGCSERTGVAGALVFANPVRRVCDEALGAVAGGASTGTQDRRSVVGLSWGR